MRWDSSVIMSDYRLDDRDFLFTILSIPALEIKQLDYEGDHSPPCSAEAKNVCCYTSMPPYIFMVWHLIIINQLHLVNYLYHIHFKVIYLAI
jgi:hypothetical protein